MFKEWLEIHKDDCFRYWVHKIMFTPYEVEEKFSDQSCFEDDTCSYGYIVEHVILPDNDILLGIREDKEYGYITYQKLSEIDLALSDKDNEDEE